MYTYWLNLVIWLRSKGIRLHPLENPLEKSFLSWTQYGRSIRRSHHVTVRYWKFCNTSPLDFGVCWIPHQYLNLSVVLVMSGKFRWRWHNRLPNFRLCQRNRNLSIGYVSATDNVHNFKWRFIFRLYTNYVWYWDDPIFKPFIGSGLGRAKTPDHFSGGHSLMWL